MLFAGQQLTLDLIFAAQSTIFFEASFASDPQRARQGEGALRAIVTSKGSWSILQDLAKSGFSSLRVWAIRLVFSPTAVGLFFIAETLVAQLTSLVTTSSLLTMALLRLKRAFPELESFSRFLIPRREDALALYRAIERLIRGFLERSKPAA